MTRGSVVLVIVLLFLPAVLLTGLAVATGGEAPEAHDLVLFAHQLLFVYWLGPDIGVYYLSGRITDPALTVEQRLAAAQTFSMIDLVPRICLSLMLTVGGVLTEYVGIPHPAWQWAGILLLGPFWLTMVLIIYFRQGTPFGATVARFDFWFRGAMIIGILASVTYSWTTGRLADTPWVAGKLILFAAILLFGLLMRVQVRPLIDGIGKMATQGPSAEVDASMATSVARTKPYVLAMWACLLLEALLGVVQPGSPDEPRESVSTAAPAAVPPG